MKRFQFLLFSFFITHFALGQDTLRLMLPQAEDLFIKQNLQLMAQKMGITESKAYELQASLRPNPNLYVEHMPYNFARNEVGGFTNNSNAQQAVQFQQLIEMAGKRGKRIELARLGIEQAENQFLILIRNLQYSLRTSFYDLYYNQQELKIYDEEIKTLEQTVSLYQLQYDKGNVPLKDLARLKAYLFSLNADKQQTLRNIANDEGNLNILTNQAGRHFLAVTETTDRNVNQLKISELLTLSEENRSDLASFKTATKQENQNYILQKAFARPDITLQLSYDRNGSYIPNYLGLGVGVPLTIFNKNQGNIEAAKVRIQSSQFALQGYQLQVQQDVITAYQKAIQADKVYRTFDSKFTEDFSKLIDGVLTNYKKQNIDVVEFIDFFDSYKITVIQYNQLQNDRMKAFEDLNYAIGKVVL